MRNGWSGGQYVLVRVPLALGVARLWTDAGDGLGIADDAPLLGALLFCAIGLACLALALGARDRIAALVLLTALLSALAGAALPGDAWARHASTLLLGAALLALHAATPRAPFLSFDGRGRPDPDGGWRLPGWIPWLARGLVAGVAIALGLGFDFAPAGAWTLIGVALLLALDPGWIPPRRPEPGTPEAVPRLFYDGDCGLCHRAVRFVLAESPAPGEGAGAGAALRVAPLFGEHFETWREDASTTAPDPIPDSLLLVLEDGRLRVRSEAVLALAARCGGLWRAGAALVGIVPRPMLDALYDFVARIRKRIFAKPSDACPILPPHLRARFDP